MGAEDLGRTEGVCLMSLKQELHKRIVAVLEERGESTESLTETTSLVRDGLLDSLALLQVAMWIEKETATRIDLRKLDMRKDWDCIADICAYIENLAA